MGPMSLLMLMLGVNGTDINQCGQSKLDVDTA